MMNFKFIVCASLILSLNTNANSESRSYAALTRMEMSKHSKTTLRLECPDKRICHVSQWQGTQRVASRDVPVSEADRIFKSYAEKTKGTPVSAVKGAAPILEVEVLWGAMQRKDNFALGNVPAKNLAAIMGLETELKSLLEP